MSVENETQITPQQQKLDIDVFVAKESSGNPSEIQKHKIVELNQVITHKIEIEKSDSKDKEDEALLEEARQFYLEAALTALEREYDAITDSWKAVESKAQVTITITGILIAGVFAFVRDITSLRLSIGEIALLGGSFSCLLCTIIICIKVIGIREYVAPPTGKFLYEKIIKKVWDNQEAAKTKSAFMYEHYRAWTPSIASKKIALKQKMDAYDLARVFIQIAIITTTLLTILVLVSKTRTT